VAALLGILGTAALGACTWYSHSATTVTAPARTDGHRDRLVLTLDAAHHLAPGGELVRGGSVRPLADYGPLLRAGPVSSGVPAAEATARLAAALQETGWFGEVDFDDGPWPQDDDAGPQEGEVRCHVVWHEVDRGQRGFWLALTALTLRILPAIQDVDLVVDVELRARGKRRTFRLRDGFAAASGLFPAVALLPFGGDATGQYEEIARALAAHIAREVEAMR
jgi:hypothetical protein